MRIDFDYLNRVKDLRKAEEPSDKVPDSIAPEPDLRQPNVDRKSDALKPDSSKPQATKADENLTRARLQSLIDKG